MGTAGMDLEQRGGAMKRRRALAIVAAVLVTAFAIAFTLAKQRREVIPATKPASASAMPPREEPVCAWPAEPPVPLDVEPIRLTAAFWPCCSDPALSTSPACATSADPERVLARPRRFECSRPLGRKPAVER